MKGTPAMVIVIMNKLRTMKTLLVALVRAKMVVIKSTFSNDCAPTRKRR